MHDAWMQMKENLAKIRELAASNPPIFIQHQKRTGAEQDRLLSQVDVAESYDAMRQLTVTQVVSTPNWPLVVSAPGTVTFWYAHGRESYKVRTLADFGGTLDFSLSYFPSSMSGGQVVTGAKEWCDRGQQLVRISDDEVLRLDQAAFESLMRCYDQSDIGNPSIKFCLMPGVAIKHIFIKPFILISGPYPGVKTCECGAAKAFNAKPGDTAHSSWCPVAAHK